MKRLLTLLTGISVVALAAVGVTRPADAQAPAYTYFPSASVTDARFLAIASTGLQTLSGNKVTIGFAAAETASGGGSCEEHPGQPPERSEPAAPRPPKPAIQRVWDHLFGSGDRGPEADRKAG